MSDLEARASEMLQALLLMPFDSCASISRDFYDLPMMPGIYAVRHRHLGLLYLGKAKKLRDRFRGGHKACTWSWLDNYAHQDVADRFWSLSLGQEMKPPQSSCGNRCHRFIVNALSLIPIFGRHTGRSFRASAIERWARKQEKRATLSDSTIR